MHCLANHVRVRSRSKRAILLLTLVGAMLLACTGIVLAQQERTTTEDLPPTSENSQREALKGIFHAQWGDPKPGSNATEKTEYVLVDDQGRERKLLLDQNDTEAEGGRWLLTRSESRSREDACLMEPLNVSMCRRLTSKGLRKRLKPGRVLSQASLPRKPA